MSIIATYIVPHPPLLVKEVGKGQENQVKETEESYKKIATEIKEIEPETIIISSPHAPLYNDYFYISSAEKNHGSFQNFGAKEVSFEEVIDTELVDKIIQIAKEQKIQAGRIDNEVELDHGVMVPLYFIRKEYQKGKIIVLGLSSKPLIEHYQMGKIIKEAVEKLGKKVVYIGSGDLSHKLQEYGPYGFAKEGPIYDQRIIEICKTGNFLELLEMKENFLEQAAECGHRSFTIMAGTLDQTDIKTKVYSHEDITGVGYGICSFHPTKENEKRKFAEIYLENRKSEIQKKNQKNDSYINLAQRTIEEYILNQEKIEIPKNIEKEMLTEQKAVFVSIHKFDTLRGCIGTIFPTTNSIAEEIIQNAISAATNDYRFPPIAKEELPYLEINVDVLEKPEKINNINELDPKKYGIIVESKYKKGVLLPDLEGIDTIDQQIKIAKKKGQITENEEITIMRFEVKRHK